MIMVNISDIYIIVHIKYFVNIIKNIIIGS